MASDHDPDRLRALEERLKKVRKEAKPAKSETAKGFSQGEVAYRMVIELIVGILLGFGLGYGLDVLFGTLPVFLATFTLLGFAAGIRIMMRTAREVAEKQANDAAAAAKRKGN